MKKLIEVCCIAVICMALAQLFTAQEKINGGVERTFRAEVEKSTYFLLEPVFVRFNLQLPSDEKPPKVVEDVLVRVSSKGATKEFRGLTSTISTSGDPQGLPRGNIAEVAVERAKPVFFDYNEDVIIDRGSEFFPEPGAYQLQFVLKFSGVTLRSNTVEINVEEPTGLNKEAFEFLNKYENPSSFYWVWKIDDGVDCLREFVDKYGSSVYGVHAISHLAGIYLARGENDKAKAEFEKIKTSQNPMIARQAAAGLSEIARRETNLQKAKDHSENPQ